MSISLGFSPERLTVKLSRFGDFTAALIYDDGDSNTVNEWPVDAELEIRFYASATSPAAVVTWPADFYADRASWHIARADVASDVLDAHLKYARLVYVTPDVGELEWAIGQPKDVN